MVKTPEELKELLVVPGLIKEADFALAQVDSVTSGQSLVELLVERDLIGWAIGAIDCGRLAFIFRCDSRKVEPEVLTLIQSGGAGAWRRGAQSECSRNQSGDD